MNAKLLIVGIGNRMRGDDAVGLILADRLAQRMGALARVNPDPYELWNVLHLGQSQDYLAILDAAQSSAAFETGAWRRFDFPGDKIPMSSTVLRNTHSVDVVSILDLGRSLQKLPRRVRIYAIAADQFGFGETLSAALDRRLPRIASQIERDLHAWSEANRCTSSQSPGRFVESH